MAKQLCRSLLLGILLRSCFLHKWKQKNTLIFLVGPSVGKQGRLRHTGGFSHRAHRTVIVSCRDRYCCCVSQRGTWMDKDRSVISNWDNSMSGGVVTKSRKCVLFSLHSKWRRWFHSCLDGWQLGCHCGPFLPLQALISQSLQQSLKLIITG